MIILKDICENLLAQRQHKVWYIDLPKHEADQMPHPNAIEVTPDLDDLYLYYFKVDQETW